MTSLILSLSGLLLRNSAEALIESSGPNATSAYATLPTPSKRSLRSSQLGPGSISNLEATSGQTENGRIAGRLSESPSVYKMTSSSRENHESKSPGKPIRARNKSDSGTGSHVTSSQRNCVQAKALIHSEPEVINQSRDHHAPKGNISEVITPQSRDHHVTTIPTTQSTTLAHPSQLTATTLLNAEMKSKLSSMERARDRSSSSRDHARDQLDPSTRPISSSDQSEHRIDSRDRKYQNQEITQNALNRYKRIQCTKL